MITPAIAWLLVLCSTITTTKGWQLVWSDEFDGNSVDQSKWVFDNGDGCNQGNCGWGNNEQQWYQSENTYVANGNLVIVAKKEWSAGKSYTSSKLITKGKGDWKYGKIEVRAKMPEGQGLWPAIWMLPTDNINGPWPRSGEMDLMELVGRDPYTVHQNLHYGDAWNNKGQKGASYTLPNGQKYSQGFHTFSIEWRENEVQGYIDGNYKFTVTRADVNGDRGFLYPFNERFYLILNVAVGGYWPGYPDDSTPFPQQMEVDYVRVYQ